jgi:undecaprenyl diphosphate synthase
MTSSHPQSRLEFFHTRRDRELLDAFDPSAVPVHVAVIMDGNGRWASRRGLPRLAGHRAGVKAVREVIASAIELGVRYLTVYSFSSENWRRPIDEVSGLMTLFVEVLDREVDQLMRLDVRVRVIGRREGLPKPTADAFARAEERTAGNATMTLVVALDYGSRAEITGAVRELASEVAAGRLDPASIGDEVFSAHLTTAGIPDPDLLIRTSGEHRLSNFLLWQIAYSELWFTSTLWPDFKRGDFLRAVIDYERRDRRFGA